MRVEFTKIMCPLLAFLDTLDHILWMEPRRVLSIRKFVANICDESLDLILDVRAKLLVACLSYNLT